MLLTLKRLFVDAIEFVALAVVTYYVFPLFVHGQIYALTGLLVGVLTAIFVLGGIGTPTIKVSLNHWLFKRWGWIEQDQKTSKQ